MNEPTLRHGKRRDSPLGAAHTNPRDAYRDIPILKQPTWNNEVAAYFFFGGVSAGSALVGSIAQVAGGENTSNLPASPITYHSQHFLSALPCS